MSLIAAVTVLIVGSSIVGVALGRWPLLRANRTTITLLGVALLLAIGAVTLQQAYAALDLNTLLLLFSMMVLNGHLFLAGFSGS
jgi:Na+/H+ antiporter NhaD/arsenite permease-like protein